MPCSNTTSPFSAAESPAVGVRVENLSKAYGRNPVLSGLTFAVEPGEIFVLMGPSGSGKSVLLKQIAGLEEPTGGRVTVNGLSPADPAFRDRVKIALVFQAGALFNSLSVYDNLALYLREHRLCGEAGIREKVYRALEILSLESAARKFPAELSGGMKKRVAIARALVMEPQLLLYDEPTSELDPVMSAAISEIIATLREHYHVTSIVVSHDRALALTIADRVGILMQGKLRIVAPPAELRRSTDPEIVDFLNPKIDLHHPRFKQLESVP